MSFDVNSKIVRRGHGERRGRGERQTSGKGEQRVGCWVVTEAHA